MLTMHTPAGYLVKADVVVSIIFICTENWFCHGNSFQSNWCRGYVAGKGNYWMVNKSSLSFFVFYRYDNQVMQQLVWKRLKCFLNQLNLLIGSGDNARYFKENLNKLGFNTGNSATWLRPSLSAKKSRRLNFLKSFTKWALMHWIVFQRYPKEPGVFAVW